jgi:hypothetical protein
MACPGTPLPFSVTITEICFDDVTFPRTLLPLFMTVSENVICPGTFLLLFMSVSDNVICSRTLLPLVMTVPDDVTCLIKPFYPLL